MAYGSAITATATVGVAHATDQIYLGAIVRSGANAGCMIGIRWGLNGDVIIQTTDATGTATNVSSVAVSPATVATDVLSCTVSISGGVATIIGSRNATPITFTGGNTTATFATEASLAAGFVMDPQNTNGTKLSQFTGTGVAAAVAVSAALLARRMQVFVDEGLILT